VQDGAGAVRCETVATESAPECRVWSRHRAPVQRVSSALAPSPVFSMRSA